MNPNALRAVAKCCREIAGIEDVWLLGASAARECQLPDEENLIVFLRDHHEDEEQRVRRALKEALAAPCGVYCFPQATMFQTPRPLLVRMAFTSGENIYSR